MSEGRDAFARSSASRAWSYSRDVEKMLRKHIREMNEELAEMNARLDEFEKRLRRGRTLNRCAYCGQSCIGPVCAAHGDLLTADVLAPRVEL